MATKRKVTVSWDKRKKRWTVGFYWPGYDYQFRKTKWDLPDGRVIRFTEENKAIAEEYAEYIRAQMVPDPRTNVCRFDPTKLSKQRKSKYALRRYYRSFIDEYRNKALTGDCSKEYISILSGYFDNHITQRLGEISLFELDAITIKDFYLKISSKGLSKKHVQNIMDAHCVCASSLL